MTIQLALLLAVACSLGFVLGWQVGRRLKDEELKEARLIEATIKQTAKEIQHDMEDIRKHQKLTRNSVSRFQASREHTEVPK